jgi:hypothetical protein
MKPKGTTPPKSFRPPPELWEAFKQRCDERGETMSEVLIRAMKRYLRS